MSTTSSGIWTTVAMANLMQKGGSIFDLPQELVDNIVNLLDKPDLSTCSILCRPWYASARPKLFHTVFIHDHKQLNPYFESADKACPCGTAKDFNIQAFSIFLKDGFDTATIRWIKGLSIRGGAPRIPLQLAIDDVIDLLIQLPSLDSLHLIDILLPSGSTADVPTTRLMKILDLNGIHVPQGPVPEDSSLVVLPTGSPIDLLNLFSSVEELSLTDTKFSRWWEGSEGYPPHILQFFAEQASRIPDSFRISKLSASHGPIQQSQTMLLYLVNTSSSLAGLRSLDIDERPQTIRTLLKSVGSTLLCLHIDIDPRPMAGAIANELQDEYGLLNCTTITDLRITIHVIGKQKIVQHPQPFLHLNHILGRLPSTTETLTIDFRHLKYKDRGRQWWLQHMNWESLDGTLASHQALKRVHFTFSHAPSEVDVAPKDAYAEEVERLKVSLPRSMAKQFVEFSSP